MKKTDWLEYFEAINGRAATDVEIAQALANGDFQEEAPLVESVTSPIYDVAEEPIPSSNTVQPNQQVYASSQQVPTQEAMNAQVGKPSPVLNPEFQQQTKKTAGDFWKWLLSAWKSPTSEVETNAYNGWIALGFLTLFYTLTIFIVARKIGSTGASFQNNLSSLFNQAATDNQAQTASNPVGFSAFIAIFVASGLYIFSVVFSGFVAKRLVYRDAEFTFAKSIEWYGRLFSINILLMGLASLFTLIGVYSLSSLLVIASIVLFGIASVFALAHSRDVSEMDMFYKYILAILVNAVVMFIFGLIASTIAAEYVANLFSNLISFY